MTPDEKRVITKTTRRRLTLGIVALMIVMGLVFNYWPVEQGITISPETTFISGPVNPDGTVNYVAAVDRRMSRGVTLETNAMPLLARAFGPDIFSERTRQEVLELLGVPDLPEKGDYFVPHPETALELLEKLANEPWSAEQHPRIAAWLERNEKPLSHIIEATKRPRYYVPIVTTSAPPRLIDVPYIVTMYQLPAGRALAARSMLKLAGDDLEGAWQDALSSHRLARLQGQGYSLIERLIGLAMEDFACRASVAMCDSGKLTSKQARKALADLSSLPTLPELHFVLVETYRFEALDYVMMLYRGDSVENPSFSVSLSTGEVTGPEPGLRLARSSADWDQMLRRVNYWYDRVAEAHRLGYGDKRRTAERALHEDLKDTRNTSAAGLVLAKLGGRLTKGMFSRSIADYIVVLTMPVMINAPQERQRALMRLELVRVAMALAAYRAEKNRYPQELAKLVPTYMKTVPQDSFSAKPLLYRPAGNGYVLYSVGLNMKDDGGKDQDQGPDDIVVRISR